MVCCFFRELETQPDMLSDMNLHLTSVVYP